jgi:regulator of nucleoside diphosphate kinase
MGVLAMAEEELVIADVDYVRLAPLAGNLALAEELSRATVVPLERMPRNVVRMHSRVTYLDERSGERREVELVFPDEADLASGKVSVLAPVGSALLGLQAGQSIDWPFPDGGMRRLRVASTLAPAE